MHDNGTVSFQILSYSMFCKNSANAIYSFQQKLLRLFLMLKSTIIYKNLRLSYLSKSIKCLIKSP